ISYDLSSSLTVYAINIINPITNSRILPATRTGALFDPFSFTATGGTAPYTFTILDGSFAGGAAVNSSGGIIGTPTFRIVATDATGIFGVKRFNQPCMSSAPAPVKFNTASALADEAFGQGFDQTLDVADGVPPDTAILAPGTVLPPGTILLSGETDIPDAGTPGLAHIWGSVRTPADYSLPMLGVDSQGSITARTFTIHTPPVNIVQASIKNGTRN